MCGSSNQKTWAVVLDYSISQEQFHVVECEHCRFRWTSPRPDQRSLSKYYDDPTYISHSNTKKTFQDKLYQIARKWALRRKYRTIHKNRSHGRVLDMGCGTGEFLAYLMGRGYLVTGVEPNVKAREEAIANHGISVLPSLDLVPANEQFQVITLWHVLEHVPDLRTTMKRLYASLADNGILVIAVPDRECWDASHYGTLWAAWDVPRHFSHFRQKDVRRLLHEHGFERIETKAMWIDAFYIAMLSERYRGSSVTGALLKGLLLGAWSNLQGLLTKAPTSSTLYIARKTEA